MLDTLVQSAVLIKKRRKAAVDRAARRGFTKFHLIDLHVRIAEIAARAHAEALTEGQSSDPMLSTGFVVACMSYDGQECPDIVERALIALSAKDGPGHIEAMRDISLLISCFADFTHSVPSDHTTESWRNLLIDISVELAVGIDSDTTPNTSRRALSRLAAVFPHLWS